jgi:hypothetical protein
MVDLFLLPFREAGRVLIMIELQLKRIAKRPTYTIGRLSIRRRERGVFTRGPISVTPLSRIGSTSTTAAARPRARPPFPKAATRSW